jgi:hypothetical protein
MSPVTIPGGTVIGLTPGRLPAPFGPTKPNIWPERTVNEMPSSATTSP